MKLTQGLWTIRGPPYLIHRPPDVSLARQRVSYFRSGGDSDMAANSPRTSRSFTAFTSARAEVSLHSDSPGPGGHSSVERNDDGASIGLGDPTELERRVLAHERILQALIGHLADDDADILTQLKARFGSGHDLGQYEQNYVSTDDFGDQFIRSIELEVAGRQRQNPVSQR